MLLKIMEDDLTYHTVILVQSCKFQDKPMVFFSQYIVITHKGKRDHQRKRGGEGIEFKKQTSRGKKLGVLR